MLSINYSIGQFVERLGMLIRQRQAIVRDLTTSKELFAVNGERNGHSNGHTLVAAYPIDKIDRT